MSLAGVKKKFFEDDLREYGKCLEINNFLNYIHAQQKNDHWIQFNDWIDSSLYIVCR